MPGEGRKSMEDSIPPTDVGRAGRPDHNTNVILAMENWITSNYLKIDFPEAPRSFQDVIVRELIQSSPRSCSYISHGSLRRPI